MTLRRIDDLDERAIRALPRYLEEAWNRSDALSYAALFTDDCDYIAFDGTRLEGRAANAKHHQRLFDSVLYGSRLEISNVSVRFITPDIALMHAESRMPMPWQSAGARRRRSLQTCVVVRNDDGWRIAAFQSVTVRPLPIRRGLALRLRRALVKLRTVLTTGRLEPAGGW